MDDLKNNVVELEEQRLLYQTQQAEQMMLREQQQKERAERKMALQRSVSLPASQNNNHNNVLPQNLSRVSAPANSTPYNGAPRLPSIRDNYSEVEDEENLKRQTNTSSTHHDEAEDPNLHTTV
eukprot:UN22614